MTGSSKKINYLADDEYGKLSITGTVSLNGVDSTSAALLLRGNLNFTGSASGTLASTSSEHIILDQTWVNNGAVVAVHGSGNHIANLSKLRTTHTSGTINLPALTTKRLDIDGNGGTTKLTGAMTITDALTTDYGTLDVDSQTLTLGASSADMNMTVGNNATVNINGGTIKMGTSGTSSGINFNNHMTLSATNATIEGYSSSNRAKCKFRVENDLEVVGTAKNLEMVSDSDTHQLTVIGHVINCTTNNTDDKFIQFHHTLDTQQLLDADESGDDDLRLTKPALDNALELMTK
jgi:hypothetical protein